MNTFRPGRASAILVASLCAVLSPTLFAKPPGSSNEGSGPIALVAQPQRLSCAAVWLQSSALYPKAGGVSALAKQNAPGPVNPGGPTPQYVEYPLIPGGVTQITANPNGSQRVCVQPFVVNTGSAGSPVGAQLYFTVSPQQAALTDPERDIGLLTTPTGSTLLSAQVPSIAARGTHTLKEAWCATLSATDASKLQLSLYLAVPAQEISLKATGATQQMRLSPGARPVSALPRAVRIEPYRTVCKVDGDEPTFDPQPLPEPQPRVRQAGTTWPAGVVVRNAYRKVSLTPVDATQQNLPAVQAPRR